MGVTIVAGMEELTAAGHALARGDPLGALKQVALRGDAPALALRGIAMAQLGDFARAKALLKRAAKAFGPRQAVAGARCLVAQAEIALASRDLAWPQTSLKAAWTTLEAHGDRVNAAHARYLEIRRLLLIGRLAGAETALGRLDPEALPPSLRAAHELVIAGLALRRLQTRAARAAIENAARWARRAAIPALLGEVETAARLLDAPAARLMAQSGERLLRLEDVEALLRSKTLVVDACRYAVRRADKFIPLARRPVLFALARSLALAWPRDSSREALLAEAFGARFSDESHRARLRVEIGRLRRLLKPLAGVRATARGFRLEPHDASVVVLARPLEEEHGAVLALLADGQSWSSSGLSLALGISQRSVQRALDALSAEGKIQAFGKGRARRWMTPLPGCTTLLLLPFSLAPD